jgi:DNA repair exonuclease SbcCD nuclease subunit
MIGKELFVTAFIADIHFGSMKSDELYSQLQSRFIKILNKNRIDMVVFGGDMFHSIISLNYSTSQYVLLFMERVLDLCAKNGIKYVRIIQGTMSHDNNQLNNFRIYENRTDVNFKIFKTIGEEELPEGLKILYVPEEYMSDPEQYYAPYLTKQKYYDFIFGHGMFKEVSFTAKNQESEVTMSKAPIFDSKIFLNACKGPIYFGHIHIRTSIKKHIHYPGSFSRFKFGEEDDKGWYLSVYNVISHRYKHQFIVNSRAEKYNTITCILGADITPESLVHEITNMMNKAEHVKLKMVIRDDTDCSYLIAYLNNMYQNNPCVKLEIKNEFEFKQELFMDNAVNKIMDKYEFLKDSSFTHEEKIQKFIKIKRGKDVPIEVINDILNLK